MRNMKKKIRALLVSLLIVSLCSNTVVFGSTARTVVSAAAEENVITFSPIGESEREWDPSIEIIIPTQEEMDEYFTAQRIQKPGINDTADARAEEISTPDYVNERHPIIISDVSMEWADGTLVPIAEPAGDNAPVDLQREENSGVLTDPQDNRAYVTTSGAINVLPETNAAIKVVPGGDTVMNTGGQLRLANLTVAQPGLTDLQALQMTSMAFDMWNNGSGAVPGGVIKVYVNGGFGGSVSMGVIPPTFAGRVSFDVSGFTFGTKTINVVVEAGGQASNSVSCTVIFNGRPDFTVETFIQTNGGTPATTMQMVEYTVGVINKGNAPTAENVFIYVLADGAIVGTIGCNGSLWPGERFGATFSLVFPRSTSYFLVVAPSDSGTTGGRTRSLTTVVNFNTEFFGGRWEKEGNFSVSVNTNALEFFTTNELLGYTQWNGINSKIRFNTTYTESNSFSADFNIVTYNLVTSGVNVLGRADIYVRDGGKLVRLDGDAFRTNTLPYARVDVMLDPSRLNDSSLRQQFSAQGVNNIDCSAIRASTVTHEFGHGLGLAHLECSDDAVMRDSAIDGSNTVTAHDRFNLNAKYK